MTGARTIAARPPRLTKAAVMAAADAQVQEEGLSSLSSRTLAARLQVTPMALYRHVSGMDEILGAVVDRLLGDLGTPPADLEWRAWLEQLASSTWELFQRYPEALDLFHRRPVTTPAARRRLAAATEVLAGAGFAGADAAKAYAAVHTYTIGFAALDSARRRTSMVAGDVGAGDDPGARVIHGFVTEEQFVHGLRALIAGLAP